VEDRGRPATSLLLREIGRHISSVLRPLDLVGQLDDERLAAVCAGVDEETTVARIADRIREVAARPLGAGGIPVIPSIGATCSASGLRRPAALLQAALEAADAVSERGGDAVQLV
jgi:GGDEF domain-containing protein